MKKRANRYIRKNRIVRVFGLGSLLTLVLLAISAVFPVYIEAETVEGTAGVVETPTLTMVVGHESANLDLIVNSSSGTFASTDSENSAAFTVQTNNYTGYTLMVSASDSKQELTNSATGKTLKSITKAVDADKFTSSDETLNKWGYMPSKLNSVDNTDFHPAPTTTATTLDITSSANTTANNYTIGLGARVDYTLASGTYTNTYILTATANPVAYLIKYYDGINNEGDNNIGIQTSSTNTLATITLKPVDETTNIDITPTRSTYTFKGWCDEVPTADSNNYFPATVCNGNTYQTGGSFNLDPTISNQGIKLYAYWKPTTFDEAYAAAGRSKVSGYYTMQTMATSICSTVTDYQASTLIDIRDNKTYTVAKIAGDCWMTQNLRLYQNSSNPSVINFSLNSTTSDVPPSYTASQPLTYTTYDIPTDGVNCWGSEDGADGRGYNNPCMHSSDNNDYGVWYNYVAATANSIKGTNNIDVPTQSICAANWTLPTDSQMRTLSGTNDIFKSVLGGIYINNEYSRPSTLGLYWSSNASTEDLPRLTRYVLTQSLTITYNARYRGLYIRCIAK